MFKKLIILLFFLTNSAFCAINTEELNIEFFNKFNDEYLSEYIDNAILNNHSAKQASQRVEQYRQNVKYTLGNELPSFSVSANYLGVKVPKLDNFELKENAFVLPFIANWEADLLLKNRDKTKSAKFDFEISQYDKKAAYIALLSDVASVYTNILQYDELIKLQEKNVEIYEKILNLDKKKIKRGIIDSEELNNSYINFKNAKNELENLIKEQKILLMELALLKGTSPYNIDEIKRSTLYDFEYHGKIPNEVPSDTIYSRPDVMAAEKKLQKAKIDIRIARKEFLPTFNITGIWTFNTLSPGTFFSWESSLAAILAGATQDIFAGGKKVANLKLKKAKYKEMLENYLEIDLEALKEVNSSLCIIKHDSNIDKNTLEKLNREEKNYSDSIKKYNRGIISSSEQYTAELKLLNEKKEAAKTKTQRIVNYFTLYKALGAKI